MLGAPLFTRQLSAQTSGTRVFQWERGLAVESTATPGMAVFLWFYEWNMFNAVRAAEHTEGRFEDFQRTVDPNGTAASTANNEFRLKVNATDDGADLSLEVTNKSDHDWPALAAIIPCLSPGVVSEHLNERRGVAEGQLPPRNPAFANENTFFLGPNGLELLHGRELRFNNKLRADLDAASSEGRFVFSDKWPTARPDATGGLIMRQSTDGAWVTGIAWQDYLSVQAHNPWRCMHLAVRVGPLKQNEAKTLRGKVYLINGSKDDCLGRYRTDFA